MALFGRYLFRQTLSAFLMIMLSLTGIVWIATALKQLTLLTSQGQDTLVFLTMTLLAVPNLMAIIAPIAVLIAALHALNRLNADSELIVMTASGASVWRYATPLLALASLVTVALLIANLFVLPWTVRTLQSYAIKVKTDLISQVLQPGDFSSPESGLTFHIRERAPSGQLLGLVMSDERDPTQATAYLAERADLLKEGETAYLVMRDGHILRRGTKDKAAAIVTFDRYVVDLAQGGTKQEPEAKRPRARTIQELLYPDPADPHYKRNPGAFRAELHDRFASALYPIAFVLIAVAQLGQARTNRQGRMQSVVTGFVAAATLRLAGFAATNLSAISAAAVPLVYLLPIGGMVVATGLAAAHLGPRRASRLAALLPSLPALPAWFSRRFGQGAGAR